jgi:hypothetical protein
MNDARTTPSLRMLATRGELADELVVCARLGIFTREQLLARSQREAKNHGCENLWVLAHKSVSQGADKRLYRPASTSSGVAEPPGGNRTASGSTAVEIKTSRGSLGSAIEREQTDVRSGDHATKKPRPNLERAIEAAATSSSRELAMSEFRKDILSSTSIRPDEARWATWSKLAAAWGVRPIPLTVEVVFVVGAALKAGGYSSASLYFSRAKKQHIEEFGEAPNAGVEKAIADAVRSVTRGCAPARQKDSFQIESTSWRDWSVLDKAQMILGSWFLMRSLEIRNARMCDLSTCDEKRVVSLHLPKSKMDQVGAGVTRSWACVCDYSTPENCAKRDLKHICPFHVAKELLNYRKGDEAVDTAPLFSEGPPPSEYDVIKNIRRAATDAGEALTVVDTNGAKRDRFRGHSLRVGGAQMLTRLGVSLHKVMLYGRWGGNSVLRYVQETPLSFGAIPDGLVHISATKLPVPPVSEKGGEPVETIAHEPAADTGRAEARAGYDGGLMPPSESVFNGAGQVQADEGFEFVINENTSTVHICKTIERVTTSVNWRARCGWKYGGTAARKITILPDDMKGCPRCFKGYTQNSQVVEKDKRASEHEHVCGSADDIQVSSEESE